MIMEKKPTSATCEGGSAGGLKINITLQWTGEGAQSRESQMRSSVVPEPRLEVVPERDNSLQPPDIRRHQKIEDFLQTVYLLSDVGDTRRGIDHIFDYFNGLLRASRGLDVCNGTLAAVNIESINATLMVAFLSITLPVKDSLWARLGFFARVRRKLVEERGEERASRLLDKYQ